MSSFTERICRYVGIFNNDEYAYILRLTANMQIYVQWYINRITCFYSNERSELASCGGRICIKAVTRFVVCISSLHSRKQAR